MIRQDAMTTVQTMFNRARTGAAFAAAMLLALMILSGCTPKEILHQPDVLVSPYKASGGDVLWAVTPLANESGVSFVDTARIADDLVNSIDEVRGLSCLPMNRTLGLMRARGIRAVTSPQEARALANALGVDGLIVGTITAYDPYDPPKIGLKLALFARNPGVNSPDMDPLCLQVAYTEFDQKLASQYLTKPVAALSEHLDGANHEVEMQLRRYAEGRHDPDCALGWKSIMASMELYTRFAAFISVSRLIEQEHQRVSPPVIVNGKQSTTSSSTSSTPAPAHSNVPAPLAHASR